MSSDRYGCAGCEKYFHELDLVKDKDGNLLCLQCESDYAAGRVPKKASTPHICSQCKYESAWPFSVCGKCGAHGCCFDKREFTASLPNTDHKIPMPECKPSISPEKTGSAGPGSDHYTVNGITPMEYVKAMGHDEYRGACVLNIIKYVSRYPYKGSAMKDLQKAKWYVDQLIIAQEEIEAAE